MNRTDALRLGRVSNLPTVWTNVLAGLVLASGSVPAPATASLVTALSLIYVAGMYLNDAFDRGIDARERPERPIPSGRVKVTTVFIAGFAMMAMALAILLWAGYGVANGMEWRPAAAGLALCGTVVFYDRYHKGNPLSPVVMGICRMLVYVTAGLAVVSVLPDGLLIAAVVLLCYLIGLTYAAKQETLGRVGNLWPLAFLAAPLVYAIPIAAAGAQGTILYGAFLAWIVYMLLFLVRRNGADVPRAVTGLIAGICLLDALLIAGQGADPVAWLAAAGFPLTLAFQHFIPGT